MTRSLTSYACTDAGNAERLIELHGRDLRYVSAWALWIAWDGKHWELSQHEPTRRALRSIRLFYKAAIDLPEDERKPYITCARKGESAGGLRACLDVARHHSSIAVQHTELDADPWVLAVDNGIVNLRTGELGSHDPAKLITKIAPVKYDAFAECPAWHEFLARVLPDPELRDYVQRLVGVSLVGAVLEHVLVFCYGAGANGKSTFLSTILAMLGPYGTPGARGMLRAKTFDKHETELADLAGRRFVTIGETDESMRLDEGLVKDLTGGDPLKARRMREDFWTFVPSHTLWLAGNHKPVIRGSDEGIWRRVKLIPFVVTIPESERDPNLPKRLLEELPGILAWAVRGCMAWQREGLQTAGAVTEMTQEYRRESDSVGAWLDAWCWFEPGAAIPRKELRKAYEDWCKDEGHEPLSARRIASRLRERGARERNVKAGLKSVDGWSGVRLRGIEEGPVERREMQNSAAVGTYKSPSGYIENHAHTHGMEQQNHPSKSPKSPRDDVSDENHSTIIVGTFDRYVPTDGNGVENHDAALPLAAAPPSSPSPTSDETLADDELFGDWHARQT